MICPILIVADISEVPMYEMAMACDNLLCDGHGRQPNPTLVVDAYMPSQKTWVQYGRTEIVEVDTVCAPFLLRCNPLICFRKAATLNFLVPLALGLRTD